MAQNALTVEQLPAVVQSVVRRAAPYIKTVNVKQVPSASLGRPVPPKHDPMHAADGVILVSLTSGRIVQANHGTLTGRWPHYTVEEGVPLVLTAAEEPWVRVHAASKAHSGQVLYVEVEHDGLSAATFAPKGTALTIVGAAYLSVLVHVRAGQYRERELQELDTAFSVKPDGTIDYRNLNTTWREAAKDELLEAGLIKINKAGAVSATPEGVAVGKRLPNDFAYQLRNRMMRGSNSGNIPEGKQLYGSFAGFGTLKTCPDGQVPIVKLALEREKCARKGPALNTPQRAIEYLKNEVQDAAQEHADVIALNSETQPIGIIRVAIGGIDSAVVDPRIVFGGLVHLGATAFIITHNHPSGNNQFSESDVRLTQDLIRSGRLLHIQLMDHVLLTRNGTSSLRMQMPHLWGPA